MTEVSNQPEPAIIVIFGITGDLSGRYLLPSLYHLVKSNQLNEKTIIIGVTRGQTNTDQLFEKVELCVNEVDKVCDPYVLEKMRQKTEMFQMDLDDSGAYKRLLEKLNSIEDATGVCMNRLYYLSIPPPAHPGVIRLLGDNGLNASCQHDKANTRLLVEKPFGLDLPSAEKLIAETTQYFSEEQIFRIDHYVAKETVQDIVAFRLNDIDSETTWDSKHIAAIEIIAKEKIGILGRAVFYEPLGALRDFIQSHLMQILGIVVMDQPDDMGSQHIHNRKQTALDQIEPIHSDKVGQQAIRGQYKSYRDEVKNAGSSTETFAAVELYSNDIRWKDVPLRLLTGKSLDERRTEVIVHFRQPQADGSTELKFNILQTPSSDGTTQPNAYERVLVDAVRGDHTIFATNEEVLASWRSLQAVVEAWSKGGDGLVIYQDGSTGPPIPFV